MNLHYRGCTDLYTKIFLECLQSFHNGDSINYGYFFLHWLFQDLCPDRELTLDFS